MIALLLLLAAAPPARTPAEQALDAQDRPRLEKLANDARAIAEAKPSDAAAQYQAAVTHSMLAQLAIETGDKRAAKSAAETGIGLAQRAVNARGNDGEYRRILGTLCGQVIPANVMSALKWGKCAMDEVNKAVELSPKSAKVWLSRGVGNYYLPASFGGGVDKAVEDFRKAIALDAQFAEAHLWLGVALRKAGKNAEARKAIEKSLSLNPARAWAKQQLEKTPAQ